jgi:SAM-dependent methyltransferase
MEHYSQYDNFAWLYNREWTMFSERVFPLLKDIAEEGLPDGAEILDLCCGTGQLARVLIENGYRVTGIDGSSRMLDFAKKNAPSAEFITDDARTFKLPPVYSAVFSTFDSLNHIMCLEELKQVFTNVEKCLIKGGIFIFDMNTEKHFGTSWQDSKEIKENPDYIYLVRGEYSREKRIGRFHCTIFQRQVEGWKRSDIILHERYYPQAEIKSALKKSGFTDIRVYSYDREHGLQKPTKNSTRVFYYAKKP